MATSIPLTQGKHLLIDDEDVALVAEFHWYAHKQGGNWYAHANTRGQRPRQSVLLHRHILGAIKGDLVDHINGNGLDNRRENLRIVTAQGNACNRRVRRDSISGVKGVRKRRSRWIAYITKNGSLHHIGTFDTIQEAAAARDAQAKVLHGSYAFLTTDRRA